MERSKIRILIVDDQMHVRKGLLALLESSECFEVVGAAANGIHAIKLALARVPDIILMDANMPYLDGFETSVQLRKNHVSSEIILMDTGNDPHFESQALKIGVQAHIVKSAPNDDLIKKILNTIGANQI